MSDLESERARVAALLHLNREGSDLEPSEPVEAAAELGAASALGFKSRTHSVSISVYVFDSYGEAAGARSKLKEASDPPGSVSKMSVNGSLLFVGRSEGSDDSERYMRRLASDFAGRE